MGQVNNPQNVKTKKQAKKKMQSSEMTSSYKYEFVNQGSHMIPYAPTNTQMCIRSTLSSPLTFPAVNSLQAVWSPAAVSQAVVNCSLGQIHVKGRGEVRGMRPDTVKGAICHCSASHYVCSILHAAEPGCILQGQASHPSSLAAW